MNRYEYDEGNSVALLVDVVPASRRVEAMRRLDTIADPLARQVLALHRNCGSGNGVCDARHGPWLLETTRTWGCETTAVIARQFGIAYYSTSRDH